MQVINISCNHCVSRQAQGRIMQGFGLIILEVRHLDRLIEFILQHVYKHYNRCLFGNLDLVDLVNVVILKDGSNLFLLFILAEIDYFLLQIGILLGNDQILIWFRQILVAIRKIQVENLAWALYFGAALYTLKNTS